jgi:hypothetical protein
MPVTPSSLSSDNGAGSAAASGDCKRADTMPPEDSCQGLGSLHLCIAGAARQTKLERFGGREDRAASYVNVSFTESLGVCLDLNPFGHFDRGDPV